jgi:hypothetical protein
MTFPVFNVGETLRAADMNAVGMWKVSSTTFNNPGFSMNNVFTSDYTNYRIVISGLCTTADADTTFRFRVGGVDNSSAIYQFASQGWYGGTQNSAGGTAQTGVGLIGFGNNRTSSHCIDILGPQTSTAWKPLNINSTFTHSGVGVIVRNIAGVINNTTAYDGFSIVSANTLTGTCTVYGYRI